VIGEGGRQDGPDHTQSSRPDGRQRDARGHGVVSDSGCSSVGPGSIGRDRIDYLGAMADSWKQQMLLNVVRLRYADAPVFVDVSSVISSYGLQSQVLASGGLSLDQPGNIVNLAANETYLDKPTISYTPLTGDRFTKSLLRPIPPAAIFSLIEAGYPADIVLRVTVRALNGIYNRASGAARDRPASPAFNPLVEAMRRIQISGVLGARMEKRGSGEVALLLLPDNPTPEQKRDIKFVAQTLKLKPEKGEVLLNYGSTQRSPNEVAVLSRSMMEILIELSAGVEVPAEDVLKGRTYPGPTVGPETPRSDRPFVRIHSGAAKPGDAFAAVHYRDTWYWVDDGDFDSKRTFTFLMLFLSLAETGVTPQTPVLTVPAN
jgi:hypothetical protein